MKQRISVSFDRAAIPKRDENIKDLRDHPSYCAVCTNLDYDVAESLYMLKEDLFLHDMYRACQVKAPLKDVVDMAAEGCSSCTLLQQCILALEDERVDFTGDMSMTVIYGDGHAIDISIDEEWKWDDAAGAGSQASIGRFELFTMRGEPCPWPSIGPQIVEKDPYSKAWPMIGGDARLLPSSTGSAASLSTIRSWMEECWRDHPYCHASFGPGRTSPLAMPARLLELGADETGLRLCNPSGSGTEYLALSHCWGRSRHLLLLKKSMQRLYQGVDWVELPRTFKDAVAVTRELGFGYLWIDSLCIIQDDPQDWQIEAAKMADIYTGAWLTIAADAGSDGDAGLFSTPPPTCEIVVSDDKDNQSKVYMRSRISHAFFNWGIHDSHTAGLREGVVQVPDLAIRYPLFTRGWTFQERLLARRVLHFTTEEIAWECLGMTSCQCGTLDQFAGDPLIHERKFVAGIPADIEVKFGKLDRAKRLLKGLKDACAYDAPSFYKNDAALVHVWVESFPHVQYAKDQLWIENEDARKQRWRELVSEYTRRKLTFAKDTLPALAGLASRIAPLGFGKYYAGLWENDLLRGLLWKCIGEEDVDNGKTPREWLAPSWSWASAQRAVDWIPVNKQPIYHIQLTVMNCHPKTVFSPFGEVSSGEIHLKGWMVAEKLLHIGGEEGLLEGRCWTARSDIGGGPTFRQDCTAEVLRLRGRTLYFLWYCTDVNDDRTGMGWERALVLSRVDSPEGNRFKRVGIMEQYPKEAWHQSAELHGIVLV